MSNINPQNIDGTFPIAGQDNNSQGFRDNFTNTINNFTFAAAELTDLQTYAVLKGPLGSVGQSGTPTNTMNYTYITQPQLLQAVETKYDFGTISTGASFQVDWTQGHFQTIAVSGTATMSFAATWPATNLYTRLRLQVTTANTTVLTLPSSVTNVNSLQGYTSGTSVSLPTGVYVFEFSTYNAGSTILINDVLRNYNTEISGNVGNFITANISGNLAVGGSIITYAGSGANITLDPDGTADVVLTNNTSLWLLDTTPTTGATSGALINYGGAAIQGNLYTGGARIMGGYQYSSPTSGFSLTINNNVERLIIDPSTNNVLATGNITLPSANVDATIVTVSATYGITALTVNPNPGTVVKPSTTINLGNSSSITFFYHSSESTWYRLS